MLKLTPVQVRDLRARAHHLHPVVSIAANGLSESVVKEIDSSLTAHELIKIRVYGDDRDARVALMQEVCSQLGAAPVQHIGKLLVVFRANPETEKNPAPSPARRASTKERAKPAAGRPVPGKPLSARRSAGPTTARAARPGAAPGSRVTPRSPGKNGPARPSYSAIKKAPKR